jgi:pilus assembly protein CpaF
MEQDTITMQEIFYFEKTGVEKDGKVLGSFRPSGIRPKFMERMIRSGVRLPTDLFSP